MIRYKIAGGKVMKKCFCLVLFVIVMFLTGCEGKDNVLQETAQMTPAEMVKDVLRHHKLAILPDFTTDIKIVAATLKIGEDEEGHEGHGHNRYLIAFPGTPDANGQFFQPTKKLGDKIFVYETLYTVIIDKEGVFLGKTVAEIGKPGRKNKAVEMEILRDIAGNFNGKVVDNRVVFP